MEEIREEAWEWVQMNKTAVVEDDDEALFDGSDMQKENEARWKCAVSDDFLDSYKTKEDYTQIKSASAIKLHPELESVAGTLYVCGGEGKDMDEDSRFVRDRFKEKLGVDVKTSERVKRRIKFLKKVVSFAPSTSLAIGSEHLG